MAFRSSPSGPEVSEVSALLVDSLGLPLGLNLDSFGRLRVSTPVTIFDTKQVGQASTSFLVENVTASGGSATYQATRSSTSLKTSSASGSRTLRQTRRYFNYQPGKSQKFDITYCVHAVGAGTVARVGYFDDSNGVFYQFDSAGSAIAIRSNVSGAVVDTAVRQADWNVDRLDGTGASGITLNPYKAQIFSCAFEWLGVGGVLCGFVVDNTFLPAQFFQNANIINSVYMRTPDLPLRWELVNTAASSASELEAICGDVVSEGGFDPFGVIRSTYNASNVQSANGTIRELLSIRLRSDTTTDAGKVLTRATVLPQGYTLLNTSNDIGNVALLWNPTFTGAGTWEAPLGGESNVQICRAGRVITAAGVLLTSRLFSSQTREEAAELDRVLALSAAYDGTPDILTLAFINDSGSNVDSRGSLTWREL